MLSLPAGFAFEKSYDGDSTFKAGPRGSTNLKTDLVLGSDMLEWYSSYLAVNKSQSQYKWKNMELVALESSMNYPWRKHHRSVPVYGPGLLAREFR